MSKILKTISKGASTINPLGLIKTKTGENKSVLSKTKAKVSSKDKNSILVKEVKSSNIKRYAYDEAKHLLVVEFNSNRIYEYYGIKKQTFQSLNRARSKGTYFANNIRNSQCKEVKNSKLLK